jgi:hypothetical protein
MAIAIVDSDRYGYGGKKSLVGNVVGREVHEMRGTARIEAKEVHANFLHGKVEVDWRLGAVAHFDLLGEAEEANRELELVNTAEDGAGELARIGYGAHEVFFAAVGVVELFHNIAE